MTTRRVHLLQCGAMLSRRCGASLALVATLLAPSLGRAESAESKAAARALAAEGVTLAREGNCEEAVDRLQRAEALYHAPSILTELGACQCQLGQLVEGTEALNRVVREPLGDDAPQAFIDAQTRAKTLLDEYRPKVANLVIHVEAPEGAVVHVAIDGKQVPDALVGVARPTDPGERKITASGEGLLTVERIVVLEEGGSDETTLRLELDPAAVEPEPIHVEAEARPIATPEDGPTRGDSLLPAYIGFGVGAVGIGVGTYFGLSAMNQQSDLDEICRDGRCPEGTREDIDTMNRNANFSTLGFGVGILGLGTGLYFLLTADDAGAHARCTNIPCVSPRVGLGQLGMEGVF